MPRNYVYTDLSVEDALYLDVDGRKYQVAQFSSGWAANEVPTAVLMLALGRNARTGIKAEAHRSIGEHKQMAKAVVWFEPKEEYDRDSDWPAGKRKIFEGYFLGAAYRKVNGKVQLTVNLLHWLAALGFSSCVTQNGHASNPSNLNSAAVLASLNAPGAGQGNYISNLVPAQLCGEQVLADVWKAIKTVFCKLAGVPTMAAGPDGQCGGTGTYAKNDAALYALNKMEGPADGCDVAYDYGRALKMDDLGITLLADAVGLAIGSETIDSYSTTSFWDKLVADLCPMFGIAVVPMVESAIVVADTPGYNKGFWKEVVVDDYDGYDLSRELHRPLRGVGVLAGWESVAGGGEPGDRFPVIGGCWVEDSVSAADGMIQYVAPPPWLRSLFSQPVYAGYTMGILKQQASKSSTTPADPPKAPSDTPDTLGSNATRLYQRYAHDAFVNSMLRGQTGSVSGKLRFDIAPLSIVRVKATTERFIGDGQDDLAEVVYGCVQRVTVSINAEAAMAGTTLTYTHVRTEAENKSTRTSVDAHPLFAASAIHGKDKKARGGSDPAPLPAGKHGSPLIPDYDFDPVDSPGELYAGDGPSQPGPAA